jgi:hypothetical protein
MGLNGRGGGIEISTSGNHWNKAEIYGEHIGTPIWAEMGRANFSVLNQAAALPCHGLPGMKKRTCLFLPFSTAG